MAYQYHHQDHAAAALGMDPAAAGNPGGGFAPGLGAGAPGGWEREKAAIEVHPLYERLLEVHVACLRVATPVDQLPRIDAQIAARAPPPMPPAAAPSGGGELNLFMVLVVRSNLRLIVRVMAPPHPVHLAARNGDLDCIRKLLAWGADRLQRDSAGGELDPCHEAQGEEGHREGQRRWRPDICRERHPQVHRAHELPPPRPIRP
ncbi:uncharacterized protein [Triticum aestivum]|uniref:uncharacterized protein isoform X2 n=1 Tax=Triticum aestivum TaxID=4565 RepID=UPI001D00A7B5|nr:uncharacterized protein LOC123137842 isoform X2 [Triticum aestivum]